MWSINLPIRNLFIDYTITQKTHPVDFDSHLLDCMSFKGIFNPSRK
jgi:hypothetical protein